MGADGRKFYAHSGQKWEPLACHLLRVARRAQRHAEIFGAGAEAYLLGLLHDLGKYSELFLERLAGRERGLDHWSPGAAAARHLALEQRSGNIFAVLLAIQGHHVGLQSGIPKTLCRDIDPRLLTSRHQPRWTVTNPEKIFERLAADRLELPPIGPSILSYDRPHAHSMLDVRMLFSALVDADHTETAIHFGKDKDSSFGWPTGPKLEPEHAFEIVRQHIAEMARDSTAAAHVNDMRRELLEDCLQEARSPTGCFTLTAPTGAGKTLAMLAFALDHARKNDLRRIVVVLPFLSIIEQTAKVYRRIFADHFPPQYVLEHHSLVEGLRREEKEKPENGKDDEQDADQQAARLLVEDWDAPIVVTTSVQLLESLFANRPRACRKLHNLARSVILFDEVQTLPLGLAIPTLSTLGRLADRYDSSVVFATATQPAFDHLDGEVRRFALPNPRDEDSIRGWKPREIGGRGDPRKLFRYAARVEVAWELESRLGWDELAERLLAERSGQALAIVNLKAHARKLARALQKRGAEGLLHLSTRMCAAHREAVLAEVRRRLGEASEPCILVSTQCVEAGVDFDFPVVYRALGPLEAIAQAAGRCNRHGLGDGRVVVFLPEEEAYPGSLYEMATGVTRSLLRDLAEERGEPVRRIDDPELFRRYYRRLYKLADVAGAEPELRKAIENLDFAETAQHYRLIEDDTVQVLVPYDAAKFDELRKGVSGVAHRRNPLLWLREAQPWLVSLRPKEAERMSGLKALRLGRRRSLEIFVCSSESAYDSAAFGLVLDNSEWDG